ncbi:hypothetical protein BGZ57DRAFT_960347 [Hyaloscypha finlandica]|nr:hypothetical protein BGZ57DRAFT_960347 [Hyaloscypha finlandica]
MARNDFLHPVLMDITDLPSDYAIEQTREAESIGWKGGENFFDGKHDDFCFVCGGTMELFECQTCDNCYHATCMSPSLPPNEVPGFWFCPHCVDRELHIPPSSPRLHYFTPVSPQRSSLAAGTPKTPGISATSSTVSSLKRPAATSNTEEPAISGQSQAIPEQNFQSQAPPQPAGTHSSKPLSHKGNNSRQRRSYSPPRKKSKYSTFSAEVDKALTVIHRELEKAAHMGRAEGGLQDKIQALEQQLKLKDGQIQLGIKELEFAKRQRGESSLLEAENRRLKEENAKLVGLVERKDAELKDWRAKLRNMIGSELD